MKLNVVPPRTGLDWVRTGIRTFLRQPLALVGLFFMYTAAVLLIGSIPVLGPVAANMLVPAATLGLMAASAEAASGRFPMPTILLSAFRAGKAQARAMLVLGAAYTAGSLLATGLGELLVGDATAKAGEMDPAVLLVLALHAPMFLLFWHAPALVHWHGIAPAKSVFFSAVACWRNKGALLVFSAAWIGVFLAVGTVLSLIGVVAGGATAVRALMLPAAMVLAAMFSTSIWFTFRDSFSADPVDGPAATPTETSP